MGIFRKTAAVAAVNVALLAFAAPMAQAAPTARGVVSLHYSCGQTRPPNLDKSGFPTASGSAVLLRGSSAYCGQTGIILGGYKLDYYCWTLGNDGNTYTYVSAYEHGYAGWAWDTQIPNNGSSVHCPI